MDVLLDIVYVPAFKCNCRFASNSPATSESLTSSRLNLSLEPWLRKFCFTLSLFAFPDMCSGKGSALGCVGAGLEPHGAICVMPVNKMSDVKYIEVNRCDVRTPCTRVLAGWIRSKMASIWLTNAKNNYYEQHIHVVSYSSRLERQWKTPTSTPREPKLWRGSRWNVVALTISVAGKRVKFPICNPPGVVGRWGEMCTPWCFLNLLPSPRSQVARRAKPPRLVFQKHCVPMQRSNFGGLVDTLPFWGFYGPKPPISGGPHRKCHY